MRLIKFVFILMNRPFGGLGIFRSDSPWVHVIFLDFSSLKLFALLKPTTWVLKQSLFHSTDLQLKMKNRKVFGLVIYNYFTFSMGLIEVTKVMWCGLLKSLNFAHMKTR